MLHHPEKKIKKDNKKEKHGFFKIKVFLNF